MGGRIKFYADEHVPTAVIRGLRRRGVDILSAPEAGLLGASDEEHAACAKREGRVIFTHDSDFLRVQISGMDHSGIVFSPRQSSIGNTINGLVLIHEVMEPKEMLGRVEYL